MSKHVMMKSLQNIDNPVAKYRISNKLGAQIMQNQKSFAT